MVLKPDGRVIDRSGVYDEKGVRIVGVDTYHDEAKGSERGGNIVFAFEVEGMRFAHLGDLGHALSDDDAGKLGPIDVMMIPIGGLYTVDAEAASSIVDRMKPRVVIPMHYKVPRLQYPISDVEPFLAGKKNVVRIGKPEASYGKAQLPAATRVDVFSPP